MLQSFKDAKNISTCTQYSTSSVSSGLKCNLKKKKINLRLNPTRGLFTWLAWSSVWFLVRFRPVRQDLDSKFIEISSFLLSKQSTCTTRHTSVPKGLPQLYIVKSFHTLFNECTNMFFAPISLKSLSASYFRSFDTLNLKIQNKVYFVSYSRSKGSCWNICQKTDDPEFKS